VTFRHLTPSGAWWRESQSVFAFFLSFLCCSTAARRCWWQLLLLLADARSIIPLFSLHATFISSHSIHHRRLSFMFIWTNVHSRTFSLRRISPELVLRSVCLSLALSRSLSLHRRSHFQAAALGAPPAAAAGRRAVQPAPAVSSFSPTLPALIPFLCVCFQSSTPTSTAFTDTSACARSLRLPCLAMPAVIHLFE
jgi:hypothetical protein